jgi:hypothetical protein
MIHLFGGAPRMICICRGYWVPRLKRGMTPENVIGLARMLYSHFRFRRGADMIGESRP